MTEYWKSIDKKFCDVCKCWLTDNKSSVSFHENGNRHKLAVQQRLKDIHKKNKADDKKDKKMDRDMRKIEEAALAASKKDMEDNPDVSMKIQSYHDRLKKEAGDDGSSSAEGSEKKTTTIIHRSDKQKKADEAMLAEMNKPTRDYNRFSGWDTRKEKSGSNFLELPSAKAISNSPGTTLQLAAKVKGKEPISFGEKTITSQAASSSTVFTAKSEGCEVAFKKRKLSKGNMRRRSEDNE